MRGGLSSSSESLLRLPRKLLTGAWWAARGGGLGSADSRTHLVGESVVRAAGQQQADTLEASQTHCRVQRRVTELRTRGNANTRTARRASHCATE